MRWAGHITRKERDRAALRVFTIVPFGQRQRGRPKKRWVDCLDSDFSIIKIKNWRSMAKVALVGSFKEG